MEEKEYLNKEYEEMTEETEPADEQAPEGQEEGTKKQKVSLLRELLSIVEIFVAAFILAQFVVHFVLINAEVPSE